MRAKVSVTLDPAVERRARQDVAEGKADSLSAWLSDAGRARIEQADLDLILDQWLEQAGGPATAEEMADAHRRLKAAKRSQLSLDR